MRILSPKNDSKAGFFVKLILCLALFSLMITSVNALEFDNVKSYNESTKTVTVDNLFGLGGTIAKIRLDTPLHMDLPIGEQKVAQFTMFISDNYTDSLKELELYNKITNNNKFERSYTYKRLSYDTEEVYEYICATPTTPQKECKKTYVRNDTIEVWTPITKLDVQKETTLTIGLFTEVKPGDYIEWIPNMFGVRIDEWATWADANAITEAHGVALSSSSTADGYWRGINFTVGDEDIVLVNVTKDAAVSTNGTIRIMNGTVCSQVASADVSGNTATFSTAPHANVTLNANTPYLVQIRTTGDIRYAEASFPIEGTYLNWTKGAQDGCTGQNNEVNEIVSMGVSLLNSGATVTLISPTDDYVSATAMDDFTFNITNNANYWANYTLTVWNDSDEAIVLEKVVVNGTPDADCSVSVDEAGTATMECIGQDISVDGDYDWNAYACNDDGLCGWDTANYSFSVDTIAPVIQSNMTNVTLDYNEVGGVESFSWNVTDEHINECSFSYNNTNSTLNCSETQFNVTLEHDNTNLTIYANDTTGYQTAYFVDWDYKLLKDSEVYNATILEGLVGTFTANFITNGSAITIANLSYNNEQNLGTVTNTGNNYTVTKNVNAASVSVETNYSFYWNITTSQDFVKALTPKNQTVNPIVVNSTCGAGMYTIYNLTLVDELSQNTFNVTAHESKIKTDFNLYTSDRVTNLINYYTEFSKTNPAAICLDNNLTDGGSYSVDLQIEYSGINYSTELYHIRNYTLDENTLNQSKTLYQLPTNTSQEFKLYVKDTSYLPIEEALVQIERKYIENGTYQITEIPMTDNKGVTSASLEVDDVIYNFTIFDSEGTLVSTFPNVRAICQTPLVTQCEIDFNAFQTGITIPDEDDSDFNYTLDYNETSRTITSVFHVFSGTPQTISLSVISEDTLGTSVCTDSLTAASGTLSCVIPNSFGNSTVLAKISKNSIEQGRGHLKLDQESSDIYGVILVFLSLMVIMTLIGIGISDSPIITAVFLFVGVLLVFALNIVQNEGFIGESATILFLAIAIILIIIKAARRS